VLTSQLDLSNNQLCGLDFLGRGTYTTEGITSIANALKVTTSMTSLSTAYNNISGDAAQQLASTVLAKPNLENFSGIPLKELRADSLTTLELSGKGLRIPEAIVLADLLGSVSPSVTECNLRDNKLGVEGWTIVFNALRDSTTSKIATWNLSSEGLGPEIAKPLAEYISVTASLTSVRTSALLLMPACTSTHVSHPPYPSRLCLSLSFSCAQLNLRYNKLGPEGAAALAPAIAVCASMTKIWVRNNQLGNEGATILCDALRESTVTKVQELDLAGNRIGPEGAKAVAAMAAVVASMTRLDVRGNYLGEGGKAALRKALEGRSGFELLL
jgi:Ran GTPase-activating protein (RanGAP) involved in mRNA processing and transport